LFNAYTRGQLSFVGIPALGSNPFRGFLFGVPAASVIGSGVNQRNVRSNDVSFFIADDWRVHPHLTLNLGIRYHLFSPFTDIHGRPVPFDPRRRRRRQIAPGRVAITAGFVQAGNVRQPLCGIPRVEHGQTSSVNPEWFSHFLTVIAQLAPRFTPYLGDIS
jgi:hypothetical protein